MRNFLIFIAVLITFLPTNLISQNDIKDNTVAIAIKDDNISQEDLRKWYVVYKGAYLWGEDLDFIECKDTGMVFERIRIVRDKIYPTKGNENFAKAVNDINAKYAEVSFDQKTKDDLTDSLFYISEGIREAMESSDE